MDLRMTWPLFSSDSKLVLEGCYKRCCKCDQIRPLDDYNVLRINFGRSSVSVSLGDRCESCRNPVEDDRQGDLGI